MIQEKVVSQIAVRSSSVRAAQLQESAGDKVRCLTCERRCELAIGQAGWCHTRENHAGRLHTLTYGAVSSLSCNPIEKKPLYHFYPGSVALTAGSYSCNFSCPWCQNWEISKRSSDGGDFLSPSHFVAQAISRDCQGTSISFNEPTLSLEWALDVFPLAHQAGLYNTFVTNGYMSKRALELLAEAGLDAMNVDVKGDAEVLHTYCQADAEIVWRNLRLAKELRLWVEVTTLVIPGVNDQDAMLAGIAERIARELGASVPWHVTRYQPAYRFRAPATPTSTLERARDVGREAGLHYVYIGNVPGHPAENTCCPSCGRTLVRRRGLHTEASDAQAGCCPSCGERIPGVGWDWQATK